MMRALPWLGALLAAAAVSTAQPPDGGPLTPTQLGEMLEKLGFEPKSLAATKDRYQFWIERDGVRFQYNLSLADSRKQLWLSTGLVEIPENAPPAALRRLLEENDTLGRPNFVCNKSNRTVYLVLPIENQGVTSARLRKEIEQLDGLARKTRPLWQSDNFVKLWGVPDDVAKEGRDALRGEWKIVERWNAGKRTLNSDLKKLDTRLRIVDGKAHWTFKVNGKDVTDEQSLAVDPRRTPKALDLMRSDGQVQAAVYELADDTLTIAAGAGLGLARPASLDEGKKGIKLVLKRTGGQP
jgi:uncharacterized protein (TIGR03067 family)